MMIADTTMARARILIFSLSEFARVPALIWTGLAALSYRAHPSEEKQHLRTGWQRLAVAAQKLRMLAERRKWPRDLSNGFGRRAQKPIHELRKELGSVITAKYRLFPASKVLGHANPGITAKYYADKKGRVTVARQSRHKDKSRRQSACMKPKDPCRGEVVLVRRFEVDQPLGG
jgi:hypothetical protein